jgi:hypothetical protein
MPTGPGPAGAALSRFGTDDIDDSKDPDRSRAYREDDITYEFNPLGYRCPDFGEAADTRILSIGDSCAFGVGLAQADLFHERFAQRLREASGRSVVNWNLAGPDKSADYVARMLQLAVPILQPHIVLILFPPFSRRECMAADGRLLDFGLDVKLDRNTAHPVTVEMFKDLTDLASPLDDELNFFRNYRSVAMLLQRRAWLFGFVAAPGSTQVTAHIDVARYGGTLEQLDMSRDGIHPGPESHASLSESFWEAYGETENAIPG